jgi:predicted enzyme related to lactoylglutathione lyase
MVTRDTAWLPGTPCWGDVNVDSVQKAATFYGALFGWDAEISEDPQYGGYASFTKGGRRVAGAAPTQAPGQPQVWTTYLATDDVQRTADKIKAAGGQVMMEPMDVGDMGRMIIAGDPAGAMFGVWQSGSHAGFQLANEPGSVCWNENMSRDWEGNKKFYNGVFGYEYGDMSNDEFSYATLDLKGAPVGGIGTLPAGTPAEMPANWTTYFGVSDTDASVAKALELGGRVVKEAFDTPQGRIAILADDQGAIFGIVSV